MVPFHTVLEPTYDRVHPDGLFRIILHSKFLTQGCGGEIEIGEKKS